MPVIDLREFNTSCFDKYLSEGDELQELEIEKDGTYVGYGVPHDGHNCDEMGCSSICHVLFVI